MLAMFLLQLYKNAKIRKWLVLFNQCYILGVEKKNVTVGKSFIPFYDPGTLWT